MIIEKITDLIGNTPLFRIPDEVHGLKNVNLFAKLEMCNPFGSVKDRIAWKLLEEQIPELVSNQKGLIENSSGNTAKAIAAIAGMHKLPFKLVSALVRVQETKDILKLLGVELEEVAGSLNCFDPKDPNDPQYLIQKQVIEAKGKLYFTSQFTNAQNPEVHYETTGAEIAKDLKKVDFLCSGLGTSGSTLGIARRLREDNPDLFCLGITASKNDFIPGIRTIDQIWEAGFFSKSEYSDFCTVESREALSGMMTLVRNCGLLCGPSSGAHYTATVNYLREKSINFNEPKNVVFIVCDRIEWYLSYIKERMPELFAEKVNKNSIFTLFPEEINSAPQLSVEQVEQFLEDSNPLIVDIRNSFAFQLGTIYGAINIPIEYLEKLLDLKSPFSGYDRDVIFICPIGEQSKRCAAQLTRMGGRGYSLLGGLQNWRTAGKPISTQQEQYF